MKSFYLTDTGLVREHNEDSVINSQNGEECYLIAEHEEKSGLQAVADGMGGDQAGEVASSIAISYLGKRFTSDFRKMSKVDAVSWLRFSVIEINSLIFKYTEDHPESKGMGTTLVLALVTPEYILFGNIGD